MARFFKNNVAHPISKRAQLEQKLLTSRSNLLILVLFTAINMVLLISKSFTYFMFSASIPYLLTDFGMFFCGLYPAEIYEDIGFETADISLFFVTLAIAICILAVYLLCWLLSKKHGRGWLIAALVMFSLDTVVMFLFMNTGSSIILDVVFHAWVIYYLVIGIYAQAKLKNMPDEPEPVEIVAEDADDTESSDAAELTEGIETAESAENTEVAAVADPEKTDNEDKE